MLYGIVITATDVLLVMELAKGDLVHLVKNKKLNEDKKLRLCLSAVEAVEYIHRYDTFSKSDCSMLVNKLVIAISNLKTFSM
jgi:hypothetical protein